MTAHIEQRPRWREPSALAMSGDSLIQGPNGDERHENANDDHVLIVNPGRLRGNLKGSPSRSGRIEGPPTDWKIWFPEGDDPQFEPYTQSDDPDFEPKAADVIGLYVNPPQHAAVFAADEKTAIQALDRLDPVLPLSPGRAERHGFEYYRHGTL